MEINKSKIIHTYNGSKWKIISNIILTLDRRDSNASIAYPCKIPQPVSYLASHPDLPPDNPQTSSSATPPQNVVSTFNQNDIQQHTCERDE